ncbi:MAG: hypothetical protein ACXWLZ_06290 [Rhizomicrobium sp.]
MQYIAFYKSDAPPAPPPPEMVKEMDKLVARQSGSGKFIMAGGFLPAEQGMRVRLSGGEFAVSNGIGAAMDGIGNGFGMLRADTKEELLQQIKDFLKIAGPGECVVRMMLEGPPPK